VREYQFRGLLSRIVGEDTANSYVGYFHELMMFPASRYDDQVDSSSHALTNHSSFGLRAMVGGSIFNRNCAKNGKVPSRAFASIAKTKGCSSN
jgi:hypothetical protein